MEQFKVGDWVEIEYANGTRIVAIISSENTVQENGIGKHYETDINTWNKWKPEVGEWCWFIKSGYIKHADLRQFYSKDKEKYTTADFSYYEECIPFIGKLPSFLKDTK